ncbi:MAG: hypothetical protein KAG18_08565 [Sinobacterium sp.]|nr:hypothetical protein [Sinobacterium sp.]
MQFIFSHGKESGPLGSKIKALMKVVSDKGFGAKSIDYSHTQDPEERVKLLLDEDIGADTVLVGSSMGGYVSSVVADKVAVKGVFLMAPAIHVEGYEYQEFGDLNTSVRIVHGINDDIIPYVNSVKFAKYQKADLFLLDSDHRLNSVLPLLEELFEGFIDKIINDISEDKVS